MRLLLDPEAAPSAALAAAPAIAATPPVTPSVPPPNLPAPISEADMARSISLSLREPDAPAATPVPPAPVESPVAPEVTPTAPAIPDPAVAQPPAEPDEPSAEVLASLGDTGKRALQAERERRKAATAKQAELQAEIDRLTALQPAPQTPVAPGQPATPAAPTPSVVPPDLASCTNFEQVDALSSHASLLAAEAMRLNTVLATSGLQAAVEDLRSNGVEQFRGVPLEQLTAEHLAASLSDSWNSANRVRDLAPRQKDILLEERQSYAQAVNLMPGLKDPKSIQSQTFAAIMSANPTIRQLGPDWPRLVARQMLGMEVEKTRTAAAPNAAPALSPATAAATTPAPGAPRAAVAHMPQLSEVELIMQRANGGKATEADMARYASAQLRT